MKESILVVDDNKKNLQLVALILNPFYQVLVAEDGITGLKIAELKKPDLIILDIMMPEMNGFEVCKNLKMNKETKDIPVIFLTAKVKEKDIEEGFLVGGSDYITKPFKSKEMLARIKLHLDLKDSKERILMQNEELKEMLLKSDKFVSIIAHNLKSPFTGLLALSQILMEEKNEIQSDERDILIESIYQSADNAYQLVDDLLIWSRIQNGRIGYFPELFFVKNSIAESIEGFTKACSAKEISIENSSVNFNFLVFADKHHVSIILNNLIMNAIKFSYPKSKIKIDCFESEKDIVIQIKDYGVGIHDKIKERLFKIEHDVSTFGTKNEKGSGLGLLICKELASINHGNIWFESADKNGSSFFFSLGKV